MHLQPDDRLVALDRRTRELRWQVQLPAGERGYGACTAPTLAPDSTTISLSLGFSCDLLVTYALETGARVSRASGRRISHLAVLDGRIWWAGWDELGYLTEEGEPITVLDEAALRTGLIYSMSWVPDESLLLLHDKLGEVGDREEYTGVKVTGETAEVVWRTPHTARGLGVRLRRGEPIIDLAAPGPDPLVLAAGVGNRVLIGRLDPRTGRLTRPLVHRSARESLRIYHQYDFARYHALVGDVLVTPVESDDPRALPQLAAYDLATGRERWRAGLSWDANDTPWQDDFVGVQASRDGTSVYTVDTEEHLTRYDIDTGKVTGTWSLPAPFDWGDSVVEVVDDTVLTRPRDRGTDQLRARVFSVR